MFQIIIGGFAIVSSLGTIWSFFFKIDFKFFVIVSILSIIILIYYLVKGNKLVWFGTIKIPKKILFILFSFVLFMAYLSTISHQVGDHGLYYTQTIKWLNEFGTVKGLGNLHTRLAFNSSWHMLSAIFNPGLIFNGSFYDLNMLMVCIMIGVAVEGFYSTLLYKNYSLQNWLKLGILPIIITYYIGIYWYRENLFDIPFLVFITQPSPDLIVSLMLVLSLVSYLEYMEDSSSKAKLYYFVMVTCFIFTIKLSALSCLFLILYVIYSNQGLLKDRKMLLLIVLILIPFFIRNIFLSGYLIFPFQQLDIFSFDWKVPASTVENTSCLIKAWAKWPGRDCIEVNNLKYSEWIFFLYSNSFWYDKALLLFAVVFFPCFAIKLIFQMIKNESLNFNVEQIIFVTILLGNILWFFQAPDFRFGYGYLVISFILVLWKISKSSALPMIYQGFFLVFLLVNYKLYYDLALPLADTKGKVNMLLSAENEHVAKFNTVVLNGFSINYVESNEYDACWEAPLPCTPERPNLFLRGATLKDGFKQTLIY